MKLVWDDTMVTSSEAWTPRAGAQQKIGERTDGRLHVLQLCETRFQFIHSRRTRPVEHPRCVANTCATAELGDKFTIERIQADTRLET